MTTADFAGWLSPSQAARLLDISTDRLRQIVREGRLAVLATPRGG